MARLHDGKKLLDIQMSVWDGSGWGPDWSNDFYAVGDMGLEYDEDLQAYKVHNVYEALEEAEDWMDNVNEYSDDTTPAEDKAVDWLILDI